MRRSFNGWVADECEGLAGLDQGVSGFHNCGRRSHLGDQEVGQGAD